MIRILVLLSLTASAATAGAAPKKEPWLWTPEERIRERFNAESKAARLQNAAAKARTIDPDAWPIDGDRNPELYFPWELMDRLLRMQSVLAPPTIDDVRDSYRKHIESAGWDYETFWDEFDANTSDYVFLFRQMLEEQRRMRGRTPNSTDRERIGRELCVARAKALEDMRYTFGHEAFDRFLYTAMTPGLLSWTTDRRGPALLLRTERGCK